MQATRHINTTVINEISMTGERFFTAKLFNRFDLFVNLRSLRLNTQREDRLDNTFWNNLEQAFPQLLALSISVCGGTVDLDTEGHLVGFDHSQPFTLEKLEVLELAITTPPACAFKSLRHCSIAQSQARRTLPISAVTPLIREQFNLLYGVMQTHREGLESIVIYDFPDSLILEKSAELWSTFPRLRMLGTSISVAAQLMPPDPETNHPFSHLFLHSNAEDTLLFLGITQHTSLTVNPTKEISAIIFNMPCLKYLTLDTQNRYGNSPNFRQSNDIERLCSKKGIQYSSFMLRAKVPLELKSEVVWPGSKHLSTKAIVSKAWWSDLAPYLNYVGFATALFALM